LPKGLEYRDPPLWSLGLYALGGAAYVATSMALRRRARAAPFVACGFLAAWLFLTLVALNTGTRDVSVPELTRAGTVELRPAPGPVYSAFGESWRGVAWVGMLSHPQDFLWSPSGAWSFPEVIAAGVVVTLACAMAGILLTRGAPAWATPPRRGAAQGLPAPTTTRYGLGAGERALEIGLVLHLSLNAVLTIVAVVGVAWQLLA